MIQAAKLASAKRITAVIRGSPTRAGPQGGAARADLPPPCRGHAPDRRRRPRADDGSARGADQGFFTIPVDHMAALPLFAQHFRDLGLTGERRRLGRAGRRPREARRQVRRDDRRRVRDLTRPGPAHDRAKVTGITGRVRDKSPSSATTHHDRRHAARGRRALREAGARDVWVFATHVSSPRRARAVAAPPTSRDRRHRHRPDRPGPQPANMTVLTVSSARRDDHERLLRRVRLGHLRRREPALLTRAALAGSLATGRATGPCSLRAVSTDHSGRHGRRSRTRQVDRSTARCPGSVYAITSLWCRRGSRRSSTERRQRLVATRTPPGCTRSHPPRRDPAQLAERRPRLGAACEHAQEPIDRKP